MKKVFFAFFLFFLMLSAAFADTSIKAQIDKTSLTTDEVLTYQVTIESDVRKLPAPKLPPLEGFITASQAKSSTISWGKDGVKAVVTYVFVLAPKSSGKFKIGAVSIKIGNQDYVSDSFDIEVSPGKPKPKEEAVPYRPQELPADRQPPQITL